MPTYEHKCEACNQEFELEYKMVDPVPTVCPLCGTDGKVKRLISNLCSGRVLLTGQDLKDKVKQDTVALKNEIARNENVRANYMGETQYHNMQNAMSEARYIRKNY